MMTITGTGAQTLIQAAVDARMSGRVMALYGMIFRAGPAVGAVLMGTLSEYLGLRLALALGAMVSGSFWLATRFRHKCMAAGLEGPARRRDRRPSMTACLTVTFEAACLRRRNARFRVA